MPDQFDRARQRPGTVLEHVDVSDDVLERLDDSRGPTKGRGGHHPGVITGKPMALGGSHGRSTAAGDGAFTVIEPLAPHPFDGDAPAVAIQGFGNAGAKLASRLADGKR